ncbi:lipopolysaccharide kinase InaA family protein [Pseudomonas sp.]|uniref:lipopolysaccharide kinase InaA family protein n=1 Tax=Pseudomonas sp. TaxID=306 RepID=UPI003C4842F5
MSFPDRSVLESFPTTLNHRNATVFTTCSTDDSTQQAIQDLIDTRHQLKDRVSAPLKGMENDLFAKSQPLDSLKPKLRVTFGRAKRDGTFDWPVEEVINTHRAQKRGAPVAGLYGFGYRKSALGLIQEFFIFTEMLDGYVSGLDWLRQERDIHSLINVSFKLLRSLHSKGVVHMDFWANNVMIDPRQPTRAKAIDLENCFLTSSNYLTEVLAFQFGFYYRREVFRFVIEKEYDRMVLEELAKYEGIDRERFDEMYAASKHENISRRARREIFHKGTVVTG